MFNIQKTFTVKYAIIAASASLALLTAVVINATSKIDSDDIMNEEAAVPQQIAVNTPIAAPKTTQLVIVANPYTGGTADGTTFEYRGDAQDTPMISKTVEDVYAYELVLPASQNLPQQGLWLASLDSGQELVILTIYKFHQDTVVSWDVETGIPSDTGVVATWESHPEVISKKTGERLVVKYSSKDGGQTWSAAVSE